MISKIKKQDITKFSIAIISLLFVIIKFFTFNKIIDIFAASLLLINNLYCLIKARKNWLLIIIFGFILYCNYSICFSSYINVIDGILFTRDAGTLFSSKALNILLLFFSSVTLFMPFDKNEKEKINFFANVKYNPILCTLTIIGLIFVFIFAFDRPTIEGTRGSESPLYEYSIILFLIGYYFSGKNKYLKILLSLILILFSLQNFIYQGRIIGIQLLLVLFLLFFADGIKKKHILPIVIVCSIAMMSMMLIGTLRLYDNIGLMEVKHAIKEMFSNYLTLDTAYSAHYTSISFIKTLDFTSFKDRMMLFGKFVLSQFLGESSVVNANLSTYTYNFYDHCFGGILPFYGYFYFGYIGVIAASIYLIILLSKLCIKNNKNICHLLAIYITVTVPRWYLYSPNNLIRGIGLLVIVYGLAILFDKAYCKVMKKDKIENEC